MQPWSIAARIAARQHLVIAVWQLTSLGICHAAIRAHLQAHGWHQDEWGVVWLPGPTTRIRTVAAAYLAYSKPAEAWARVTVDDWNDEDAVADAVVAAARASGLVICGPTAAWLHGLTDDESGDVWILLAIHNGQRKRSGIRLRYGTVTQDITTVVNDLPVLNSEHTIIDNARVPARTPRHLHYQLVRLLRRAERQRVTTRAKVDVVMARAGKFRGKPVLRDVLADLAGEFTHSLAEARARPLVNDVLGEFGLQLHPEPMEIWLGDVRIAEADLAVVDISYDLEVDGPHHLLPEQQEKDRNRDRLVREAGWFPERFPTELIELSPRTFQAQVRQTVRRLVAEQRRQTRFS